MRKSECSLAPGETFDPTCAARSSLRWQLRGVIYDNPPADLLLSPQKGDMAILTPPLSKADQTGEVWGSNPIYLPFMPGEKVCAFTALARIEVQYPTNDRAKEPLISPDGLKPFAAAYLDRLLPRLLTPIVGAARAKLYSWHSFRIMLACALLASGATRGMIQALCRWQSEESLNIYARLNATTYCSWIQRMLRADILSVSAANLPTLSSSEVSREILQDLATRSDDVSTPRRAGGSRPDGHS